MSNVQSGRVNPRRLRITSYLALVCIVSAGCVQHSETADANQQVYKKLRSDTERALEIHGQADAIVDYERPDQIQVRIPGQISPLAATDDTLARVLAGATAKRDLVVVILGPQVRHAFPEPKLQVKVDAIAALIKETGFTRVDFHLTSAFGYIIYRE